MYQENIMKLCTETAEYTMLHNEGGPFGAAITKNDELIFVGSNSVLKDNDPTAHAEINAIREAGKILNTYDLSDCELYATGCPCPMCMSAIVWANIKKVYVSGRYEQAKRIGFRDDYIYDFIKSGCKDSDLLDMEYIDNGEIASELYNKYESLNKSIY